MATITFSGLGSGLDYSSWIDALVEAKQTPITTVKSKNTKLQEKVDALSTLKSSYTSLQTTLQKFADAGLSQTSGMFSSMKATSNNSAVSVTAENGATEQSFSVEVSQLATNTTVIGTPTNSRGVYLKKLSDLGFDTENEGKTICFSVDNKQYEIKLNGNMSLYQVMQEFRLQCDKVSFNINDKNVTIQTKNTASKLVFSSAGATEDFLNALNITESNSEQNSYTSNSRISVFDTSKALCQSAESGFSDISVGSQLIIGNATFTIDENTTMNSLLNEINTNKDSGVKASFDASRGEMKLTSTTSGALAIKIGGDAATQLGLTASTAQTLGKNAKYSINGQEMSSFSNTITSSNSGLEGITLTLNKVTEEDSPANVTVESDPSELAETLAEFVDAYNQIIKQTATYTKVTYSTEDGEVTTTKAALAFDSQLSSMLSDLKSTVNSTFGTGSINLFSKLGISTAEAGASTSDNTQLLEFDKEAFLEAYKENPSGVKDFLVGQEFYTTETGGIEYTKTDTNTRGGAGVFGKMKSKVDSYLLSSGYFAIETDSYNAQIANNNTKISKLETNIESYRASLEKKFQAMDSAISSLNTNYSYISSLFSSSSNSNSSS